jgi:hypothetical protein
VRRHGELDEAREDDATTKTRRVDSASLGARLAMRGGRGHDAVAHMLLFSSATRRRGRRSRDSDLREHAPKVPFSHWKKNLESWAAG